MLAVPSPAFPSPYLDFGREEWARLRDEHPMSLTADEVARVRGLGDRIDVREVEDVYLPLSRLLLGSVLLLAPPAACW